MNANLCVIIVDKANNCASFIPVCYVSEDKDTEHEKQRTNDVCYQFALVQEHDCSRWVIISYFKWIEWYSANVTQQCLYIV